MCLDLRRSFVAQSYLVTGAQEAAEIGDWIVGGRHLTQVIPPDVGLDGAPGELLARNLHDGAVPIDPGIGDRRDREADLGTGTPEASGEVVGEKQRVVAALAGEQG